VRCSVAPGCGALRPGQVAVTVNASCALVGDGTVKCWGDNTYGELGNGRIEYESLPPATVPGLSNVTMLSAGQYHVCALTDAGTVSCWGLINESGTPLPVEGLSDVTMIASGQAHVCALRRDGSVWCWGSNNNGAAGGEGDSVTSPLAVSGIDDATFVAAGQFHSCAVLADGSVKCWGWNAYGQLGDGTQESTHVPVSVQAVSGAAQLALGRGFSCVLSTQFRATCWGDTAPLGDVDDVVLLTANQDSACIAAPNAFPQCSSGALATVDGLSGSPDPELELAELQGMSAGQFHACVAVGEQGARSVWCWGNNVRGALGYEGEDAGLPVRVPNFP
jgi:alpha-tubulin suppressor-like RCC1 family protein